MTTINSTLYPVDYSGRSAANLVTGEQHALTGSSGHDFYFIVPKAAPYFEESLKVMFRSTNGETYELRKGIEYYPSHNFLGASRACALPIHGSVTFLNTGLVGTATLRYQTLGGEWVEDMTSIAEILADRIHNPRTTTWEQVVDVPALFPVVNHPWNLVDLVGMSAVVASLNAMSDVILQAAQSLGNQHINATGNVHGLTAEDIGAVTTVELMQKVREALAELEAGSSDNLDEGLVNLFFTEARVLATLLGAIPEAADTAIDDEDRLIQALAKLQVQITAVKTTLANKANAKNPSFTGMTAEHIETVTASTSTTSLDLSLAGVWNVNVGVSSAIVFDITKVNHATGKNVEFVVSTRNTATAGLALSWPANVKWVDGVTPPRTTEALARDDYYFYSDNDMASWTGSLSNKNVK